MRSSLRLAALPLLLAAALPLHAQRIAKEASPAGATTYHVSHRVQLGGTGGWDYLAFDTASHRVFVTRGTHVMVIDARADTLLGDIPDTPGVHGVALAPDLGKGYASDGRDSSIAVFDYATLAPTRHVHEAGANPDAITYDSATRRVFAFNGRSGDAVVLDAMTDSVIGTIALGGKPEFAVTDGRGMLWVNVEDRSEIAAIDTRTLAVTSRWSVKPCEEPSGLAIDRAHRRLFSVCDGVMAISDPDARRVVATVKIGAGPDAAAFDAATGLAFASNGDGSITVVRELSSDAYRVVQTVRTMPGARTMTLDPVSHRLYTVSAEFEPSSGQGRPPMKPGTFTLIVLEP